MASFLGGEEVDAILQFVGGHHAVADRDRAVRGGVPQDDGRRDLGLEAHPLALVGLDAVSRKIVRRPAIGRDRAHGDGPGTCDRTDDRRHDRAGTAIGGKEIEQPVPLRQMGHDRVALGLARVLPLPLAERRNGAFERVVEIGILPDRALPHVAEQRRAIELRPLKPDIGGDIGRRGLEDRLGLQLAQLGGDRIETRGRRWSGRSDLWRWLGRAGLGAIEPVPEPALSAVKPVIVCV